MDFLKDFGVKPILLAAQVVNFLILLWILNKFLYGPILKILAERKRGIEESLKKQEAIEIKLQETNDTTEKILAKTLAAGQKIVDEANKGGAQILEEAQKTAAGIINRAYIQVLEIKRGEKVKLEQEIRENLGDLVVLVFEKITGKKVTTRDQREIIEKEIKNLS